MNTKFCYSVHNSLPVFNNLNNLDLAKAMFRYDRFAARSHSRGNPLLGSFVLLRKASVSFVTAVRLSSCITESSIGRISMKFDIGDYYENLPIKSKFG